jgi:urease accessory protein
MSTARLALLHLCDSLFPVGAFAHSDGLESAVVSGQITTLDDLRGWLEAILVEVMRPFEGPVLREAMRAAHASELVRMTALNRDVEAMRPSRAGRDAARTMGVRLLRTWQEIRPSPRVAAALAVDCPFAFPVAFGIVADAEDIPQLDALEGYCYIRLASAVSAAMRLMPLGQLQAHAALSGVLAGVPAVAAAIAADAAPPRSFAPLMDVATMSHRYVHSRLFRT